jgi:hypothetical protein
MHKRVSKAPVEDYNKHAKVAAKQWKCMLCSILDTYSIQLQMLCSKPVQASTWSASGYNNTLKLKGK